MTGLVLADAAVIAGGFADSLGQALTSPWMLAVPAALALTVSLWLKRRSRVTHVVFGALPEPCRWCGPGACWDATLCACLEPCGKPWCKGEVMTGA